MLPEDQQPSIAASADAVSAAERLVARPLPPILAGREIVHALFVPRAVAGAPRKVCGVHVLTSHDVIET